MFKLPACDAVNSRNTDLYKPALSKAAGTLSWGPIAKTLLGFSYLGVQHQILNNLIGLKSSLWSEENPAVMKEEASARVSVTKVLG